MQYILSFSNKLYNDKFEVSFLTGFRVRGNVQFEHINTDAFFLFLLIFLF